MCGIAGFAGLNVSPDRYQGVLDAMCSSMIHRGPDDAGTWHDDVAGIGMRRLSIIDIAGGHQPLASDNERYQIVFNGEIYNYRELRSALEARGVVFKTRSDTEVLLAQFIQSGWAGLQELNGMFAFAIWDRKERQLFLVRDRLGVKPLYYAWDGKSLLFGSEIKAILAGRVLKAGLNLHAVWDFLTFRYVPGPQTIWQGIYKLQPGHALTWRADKQSIDVKRYWQIPYVKEAEDRGDQVHDREFGELIADAVRLRMIADVPVGVTLSGGLDSSVVAALAARHTSQLNTFSVAFRDSPETDERVYARTVAGHIGSRHHEIEIGQKEFVGFLPGFVRATDEPLADLASIPLYFVSKLARGEVKVALSGEGSDEVLAGYDFQLRVKDWDQARRRTWLQRLFGGTGAVLDQRKLATPPTMTNYMTSAEKTGLMKGLKFPDSLDPLRCDLDALGAQDPLHQVLFGFCQHWLVEDLLMKADKMSMATSLELRTPFLDYRLVEWAACTPSRLKASRNDDGRYVSKRALRRFAGGLLPSEIIERPKQGFPVPVYDWLSGPLKGWSIDLLQGSDGKLSSLFDRDALKHQCDLGIAADAPILDRHRLWNLLVLETWMREWQQP